MLVLDENVIESQRRLFLRHRIHVRQIGVDLAGKGASDDDVQRLLHTLKRPTLLTRDEQLFRLELCHPRYCIAILDVRADQVFETAVRLLELPEFKSAQKRMGQVIRAGEREVRIWSFKQQRQRRIAW